MDVGDAQRSASAASRQPVIDGLARRGELWHQPISGTDMMAGFRRGNPAVKHAFVERGRVAVHIEIGACHAVDQRGDADRTRPGSEAVDAEILKPAQRVDRLRGLQHAGGIAAAGMRTGGNDRIERLLSP